MDRIHENISASCVEERGKLRDEVELLWHRASLLTGMYKVLMTMYLRHGNSFRQITRLVGVFVMIKKNQMTCKQVAVLEDLLSGDLSDSEILAKHHLSRHIFNKWLSDERFKEHFLYWMEANHLQSRLIIARYSSVAAAKLIELTESKNSETSRKACLDIISLSTRSGGKVGIPKNVRGVDAEPVEELSDEQAEKILAALAGDDGKPVG